MYPVRSSFPCLKNVNTFVNVVYNLIYIPHLLGAGFL